MWSSMVELGLSDGDDMFSVILSYCNQTHQLSNSQEAVASQLQIFDIIEVLRVFQ